MWSDIFHILLTVVLSIAFLFLFGEKSVKRYFEGGISKIRDEEELRFWDAPIPGDTFFHYLKK